MYTILSIPVREGMQLHFIQADVKIETWSQQKMWGMSSLCSLGNNRNNSSV